MTRLTAGATEMEDGSHGDCSAIVSMLVVSAGATVAAVVEVATFTAAMSTTLLSANVSAAVRPLVRGRIAQPAH